MIQFIHKDVCNFEFDVPLHCLEHWPVAVSYGPAKRIGANMFGYLHWMVTFRTSMSAGVKCIFRMMNYRMKKAVVEGPICIFVA